MADIIGSSVDVSFHDSYMLTVKLKAVLLYLHLCSICDNCNSNCHKAFLIYTAKARIVAV